MHEGWCKACQPVQACCRVAVSLGARACAAKTTIQRQQQGDVLPLRLVLLAAAGRSSAAGHGPLWGVARPGWKDRQQILARQPAVAVCKAPCVPAQLGCSRCVAHLQLTSAANKCIAPRVCSTAAASAASWRNQAVPGPLQAAHAQTTPADLLLEVSQLPGPGLYATTIAS
jgi:hypothetical protein